MAWISEEPLKWHHRLCCEILKCGPVPRHIAFIMDGNRRYATKEHLHKFEGHSKGFDKLSEALLWCKQMDITEVTVYAFSIENFKRSKEEVDTLMHLAEEKFAEMLKEKAKLNENGICVRVLGRLELLSDKLRSLIAETVLYTKNNSKAVLNVAFAYTSTDEILNSIEVIHSGIENGQIVPNDVNEELVTKCMYSGRSSKPDLLIRTSGEVRFSDFLLWQSSNTNVVFTNVLWPDFCIWHFFGCILRYQRSYGDMEKHADMLDCKDDLNVVQKDFVRNVEYNRFAKLENWL